MSNIYYETLKPPYTSLTNIIKINKGICPPCENPEAAVKKKDE